MIAVLAVGVLGAVWAVWRHLSFERVRRGFRARLERYSGVLVRSRRDSQGRGRGLYSALHSTARARVEAARIQISPREYLQMVLAAFLSGAFFGLLMRGWFGALLVGSAFAYGVWLWPESVASRRRRRFVEALPGAVDSIVAALRAGQSIHQAVAVVAREYGEPVGTEFRVIHEAVALGASMPEEFRKMALRVGVEEVRYLESAIALHQRSGADLAHVMERVSDALRTRMELQAEMRAMTSQVRMSGRVLMWLPVVLFAGMWFIDRDYGGTMLGTAAGRAVLVVSALLMLVGRQFMRRIAEAV